MSVLEDANGRAVEDDAGNTPLGGDWMKVEIFGHRVRCGLVSEVEAFGTKMLQVEVFEGDAQEPSSVERYGGGSIFSVTPCTERFARDHHRPWTPRARLALPPAEEVEAEIVPDEDDMFADPEA